jgi:hypothetical protein
MLCLLLCCDSNVVQRSLGLVMRANVKCTPGKHGAPSYLQRDALVRGIDERFKHRDPAQFSNHLFVFL